MLKRLNGTGLVRFEPTFHTAILYGWYYSGDYPEFYRNYPNCPTADEIAASAHGKTFMIINDKNDIVGCIMYFKEDEFSRNFELAVLIDKKSEKQGFAFNALRILMNWKFNFCNLYKAIIQVVARNDRLCMAVENFGASCEGILRKQAYYDGDFRDIAVYSMFKPQFNDKYQADLKLTGPRLDAPILKAQHGQAESGQVAPLPGAAVRGARTAS